MPDNEDKSVQEITSGGGESREAIARAYNLRQIQKVASTVNLRRQSAAPAPTAIFSPATAGIETVTFDFLVVNDPFVAAYNVYRSDVNNAAAAARIDVVFQNPNLTGSMHYVDAPGSGKSLFYWVSAVNSQGKESARVSMQLGDAPTTTGVSVSSGQPFPDGTALLYSSTDATKKLKWDLSSVSSGTTRTWHVQDKDLTVAGLEVVQRWTASQTFSFPTVFTDSVTISNTRLDFTTGLGTWSLHLVAASQLQLFNNLGGTSLLLSTSTGQAQWALDQIPLLGVTYSIGNTGGRWLGIFTKNLDVSGLVTGDLKPATTNTYELGDTTTPLRWKKLSVVDVDFSGYLNNLLYISTSNGRLGYGIASSPATDWHAYASGFTFRMESNDTNSPVLQFYGLNGGSSTFWASITAGQNALQIRERTGNQGLTLSSVASFAQLFSGSYYILLYSTGQVEYVGVAVASLPAANNGSLIYSSDAKNIHDDGVAAGSVATGSGHGCFLQRINGNWLVM
jgi:hypothetical protein